MMFKSQLQPTAIPIGNHDHEAHYVVWLVRTQLAMRVGTIASNLAFQ